jgi:uncharacterized repeat protein (TIGR03803 family)
VFHLEMDVHPVGRSWGWRGPKNVGTVFKLGPNGDGSWTESVLYAFSGGDDEDQPIAGLIFDGLGNLYGTTMGGGLHGVGTVFELIAQTNGSWKEKVIHHFMGGADGSAPIDGLAFYADGNIYGTAEEGGDLSLCTGLGCGVVFRLAPDSDGGWKETVLHRFLDHPGAHPANGTLIFDSAGNIYGTTAGDRTATVGSVFEITP